MKPNFNNFVNKVDIVATRKDLDKWIVINYKKYSWSQKIRVWIFNKLFKNKICKI